ncbi:hypothetical protein SAMD00019534_102640, partial [Acytostelium subglobosum LB1]|uniref:hypothetical protein n=1 Tax=Acytostelium subglobosum LB1 TaxID=1410327 RepID=UPI00064510C5
SKEIERMSSVFKNQNISKLMMIKHNHPLELLDLPDDILLYIFSYLDEQSLTRVSQISNFFNSISSNHNIWKELFRVKWGPMFPLVPVCTINCCHKYFSDPYANLEPINMLFSLAFYKSLMLPAELLAIVTSSYSFKLMFKFRKLLFSYYTPLLNAGLKLMQDTLAIGADSWQPINDSLARPSVARVPNSFNSLIDKTVLPNRTIAVLHEQTLVERTTTTYCIRITRLIPTRILKKMLALIIDYEKIPLWDVALRHCTGMVIKSPETNQKAQIVDEPPIKKVDLLHKQIMGNLYMTYARMVYTNSTANEHFLMNQSTNGVNDIYTSSTTTTAATNNTNSNIANINNNNFNNNNIIKASLSNNGIINAMEVIKNKLEQQQLKLPAMPSPHEHDDEDDEYDDDESYTDSSDDDDDTTDDVADHEDEAHEEDRAPSKRMRRVDHNAHTEVRLKEPIYVVQHNIPFHVKGMTTEVQPFQLDCFGSGFLFEPVDEVKLTYLLQLIKSEWMEDEAQELLDDLAISRSRSLAALISHAYQLSRQ